MNIISKAADSRGARIAAEIARQADNAEFLNRGRKCLGDVCRSSNKAGLIRTAEMFKLGHAVCDLCAAQMSPADLAAADGKIEVRSSEIGDREQPKPKAEEQTPISRNTPKNMTAARPAVRRPESARAAGKEGDADTGARRPSRAGAPSSLDFAPPKDPPPAETPSAKPVLLPPLDGLHFDKLAEAIGRAVLDVVVGNLCEGCLAKLIDKIREKV